MGVVAAVLALALVGCYSPTLKDCAVSCASADECANGQSCANGWCAGPETTCNSQGVVVDAPPATPDAQATPDAGPTPDAPSTNSTLRVTIKGKGKVVVAGVGTCDSPEAGGPGVTCNFGAISGAHLTATATPTDNGHDFEKWTDLLCKNQQEVCMFTELPFTVIQAQFK